MSWRQKEMGKGREGEKGINIRKGQNFYLTIVILHALQINTAT